jgi:aspartyl-tRNA(Asn)/glutamyl-tRNA(Gln) amidotransferase subunit A
MSTELVWLDATELAGLVASREITAVEVVAAHLARIAAVGDQVNAFVTVLGEQALEAARRPQARAAERCAVHGQGLVRHGGECARPAGR